MTNKEQKLYQAICQATGKESLTDAEIHKITLFLQGRLGQPGDPSDLGLGESFYVNSDLS